MLEQSGVHTELASEVTELIEGATPAPVPTPGAELAGAMSAPRRFDASAPSDSLENQLVRCTLIVVRAAALRKVILLARVRPC